MDPCYAVAVNCARGRIPAISRVGRWAGSIQFELRIPTCESRVVSPANVRPGVSERVKVLRDWRTERRDCHTWSYTARRLAEHHGVREKQGENNEYGRKMTFHQKVGYRRLQEVVCCDAQPGYGTDRKMARH